jgi:hypothetical protein
MQAEEIMDNQEKAAVKNYDDLLRAKYTIGANTLIVAQLLKECRDNGYWKVLKHDSFEGFLGSPELGFRRSKAYALIQLYELYVDKLNVPADRMLSIGTSKLSKIAPIVESDVEGWLSKAEHLSKSDLSIELGRVPGKSISPPTPASVHSPGRADMTCINGCGPGEKSHFPVTRGAGGKEVEDWWVPMCRVCHYAFHANPSDFTWMYKRAWAKYLYGLISRGE